VSDDRVGFAFTLEFSMPHQDSALLAAYRNGETWAFESIYRRYVEPVRCFLRGGFSFASQGRMCRFRGAQAGLDLEGIVQEVFARVFAPATRANFDGERPFKNYAFSIAKNLVLRELGRRERVSAQDGSEVNEAAPASHRVASGLLPEQHSPEKLTADAQLSTITGLFVAGLTGLEHDLFEQRFVIGATQEATAETMGVSRARVKSLEADLRARLMAVLHEGGYFVGHESKRRWSRKAA
jgi:RNA polymerase sigma factor (sigma-70 family)